MRATERELTDSVENLLELKADTGVLLMVLTSVRELTDMVENTLVVAP